MAPTFDAGSPAVSYYAGYLNGVADGFDVTVLEVFDACGIEL